MGGRQRRSLALRLPSGGSATATPERPVCGAVSIAGGGVRPEGGVGGVRGRNGVRPLR